MLLKRSGCSSFQRLVMIKFRILVVIALACNAGWVQATSTKNTPTHAKLRRSQCAVPVAEITELMGHIQAGAAAEWLAARDVVVHTPGEEIFLGVIHPDAALFEKTFSLEGAIKEHENFICLLKDSGARVFCHQRSASTAIDRDYSATALGQTDVNRLAQYRICRQLFS